jgi:hypothetical protein
MKSEVIAALKSETTPQDKFNKLLRLFLSNKNASPSTGQYLNRTGYSDHNLRTLEYDIKKLYGISDIELHTAVVVQETKAPVLTGEQRLLAIDFENANVEELAQEVIDLTEYSKLDELLPAPLPEFSKGLPGNKEMMEWLDKAEVVYPSKKKADLLLQVNQFQTAQYAVALKTGLENLKEAQALILHQENLQNALSKASAITNIITSVETAPEDVKTGLKLRVEFPFLNEEDCPDKFKILVADKFIALNKFAQGHKELKALIEAGDTEALFETAADVVKNWELNQEIYDELTYYNEHNEILGNHSIFQEDVLVKTVAAMSTQELMKRQGNLRSYISRDTPKAEKMKDNTKKEALQSKLSVWGEELKLIDERLAADAKK